MARRGYHQRVHLRAKLGKVYKAGRKTIVAAGKAAKIQVGKVGTAAKKQMTKENAKRAAVVAAVAGTAYIATRPATRAKIKQVKETAQRQIALAEQSAKAKIVQVEQAAKRQITKENAKRAALAAAAVGITYLAVKNRKQIGAQGSKAIGRVRRAIGR